MLELGAGHGKLSQALLEHYPKVEVTVTDIDPISVANMAASGLGAHPRAIVRVEDATAISAPNQTYDLAVIAQSFHHLTPKLACEAISEATRVANKFLIIDLRRFPPAVQALRRPLKFALVLLGEAIPLHTTG